jgi:hypothetical protein
LTPLTLHLITFNLPYAVSSEEASWMGKEAIHLAQYGDLAVAKKHKAGEISQRRSE